MKVRRFKPAVVLHRARRAAVPLVLALGVALTLFFQTSELVGREGSGQLFAHYTISAEDRPSIPAAWEARVLAPLLSSQVVELSGELVKTVPAADWHGSAPLIAKVLPHALLRAGYFYSGDELRLAVGLWTALWFLAICAVLFLMPKDQRLLLMFGTFAGVSFGYTQGISTSIAPWDMPSLFFFTAFLGLWLRGEQRWILFLIPVAVCFKETAFVLAIPLAAALDGSLQRRATKVGLVVLVALGIRHLIAPGPGLGLTEILDTMRFTENLVVLGEPALNHPFWINAGTLAALFIIPLRDRRVHVIRATCLFFALGMMLFGVIEEYRIWFELIPFALVGLLLGAEGPGVPWGSDGEVDEPGSSPT